MKIDKMTSKYEQKTAMINIIGIKEKSDINGHAHIYITSEDGRCFSNFKNVWDRQGINLDDVDVGDQMEVTYVTKEYHGRDYNNFTKVVVAKKSAQTANEDDDLQKVIDSFNK